MKKRGEEKMGRIDIGGNAVGSNINMGGKNVNQNVRNISNEVNVQNIFRPIVAQTEKIKDPAVREDVSDILNKLQVEARKGIQADERRVQSWMNFLAEIAPDVWDVAIRTFINPIDGISLAFRKVATKAMKKK